MLLTIHTDSGADVTRSLLTLTRSLLTLTRSLLTIHTDSGADVNIRNNRRVATYYHTFSKNTGKPKLVKRGDVAFDYARTDRMRNELMPDLNHELAEISRGKGLDPLYGSQFTSTNAKRAPSPNKERALGRSVSPVRAAEDGVCVCVSLCVYVCVCV